MTDSDIQRFLQKQLLVNVRLHRALLAIVAKVDPSAADPNLFILVEESMQANQELLDLYGTINKPKGLLE